VREVILPAVVEAKPNTLVALQELRLSGPRFTPSAASAAATILEQQTAPSPPAVSMGENSGLNSHPAAARDSPTAGAAARPLPGAVPEAKRRAAPIDAGLQTEVLAGGADLVISALKQERVARHLKSSGHAPDWRTADPAEIKGAVTEPGAL